VSATGVGTPNAASEGPVANEDLHRGAAADHDPPIKTLSFVPTKPRVAMFISG